jgi:hypothetical protein
MQEQTVAPYFKFKMEQYGPDGKLKASEEWRNTVVTAGKNSLLDIHFRAGTGPTWFLGMKGTGSVAAGDTMSSHAGWVENTAYGSANRLTMSFAASVGGTATHAPGTFAMTGTYTVAGAFITTGTAVGGTVGTLYSGGDFAQTRTGGTGDTLVITPTLVIT